MNESTTCNECGTEMPDNGVHGLCPSCLMKLAMQTQAASTSGETPEMKIPSVEEMASKFPNYEITECLGRGGMGVVYKARQKSLERWVAIKILAPERVHDEKFTEHFEREAKTLARMSHPNIVTVFDHGKTDDLFYIVMEYVDGVNLRDLLRDGKMDATQALAIVPPVCEALEYAHGKDVVHRDIKPENLLLDRDGRVKIADFGIASLIGVNVEKSGTPPYVAPEQDHGRADRRADIYSLGVVLYEMLTGERPADDLIAPSRKVEVDVKIDEIVLQAMEKDPSRRYQSANEFRTRVETFAATPLPRSQESPQYQAPSPSTPPGGKGHYTPPQQHGAMGSPSAVQRIPSFSEDSVNSQFRVFSITWWVGLPLLAISSLGYDEVLSVIGLIGLFPAIVAIILSCILVYRAWFLLQGYGARTTPGKAVGFGFIPFYCFYWWFVAYVGLVMDTNSYLDRTGNTSFRMSYGLAMTYCIIGILGSTIGLLPILGTITTILSMLIGHKLLSQIRDAVLIILKQRIAN